MNKKRILFLGGSYAQIPIIKEAKKRGWYIITCDYLPQNPGHKLANEYYNVSTTDKEGVLNLAKKVKPHFIVAYASDPAAPVAAYVSEKIGLEGNPYESIRILSEKDLFRFFLKKNGFNTPNSVSITIDDDAFAKIENLKYPIMVKPTDSSGSKGVSKVNNIDELKKALDYAFSFSRNKRIIAEEFIDNEKGDIHGDGFVINGELFFSCLGDHIYNSTINPFNPTGTTWPTKIDKNVVNTIEKEIAEIIHKTGFKNGPINIEARITKNGTPYVMEIGPRNGGHFVPQAIEYATGFNMVKALLDVLDGKKPEINKDNIKPTAYIAIHSDKSGVLEKLKIDSEIKPYIKEFHQYIQPGEKVKSFQGANAAIGILLLSFHTREEMDYYISNINNFISLQITSE